MLKQLLFYVKFSSYCSYELALAGLGTEFSTPAWWFFKAAISDSYYDNSATATSKVHQIACPPSYIWHICVELGPGDSSVPCGAGGSAWSSVTQQQTQVCSVPTRQRSPSSIRTWVPASCATLAARAAAILRMLVPAPLPGHPPQTIRWWPCATAAQRCCGGGDAPAALRELQLSPLFSHNW